MIHWYILRNSRYPSSADFRLAFSCIPAWLRQTCHVSDLETIDKAECPDYLKEGGKVVSWNIPGTPGMDDEAAGKLWDQVQLRVEELVRKIG